MVGQRKKPAAVARCSCGTQLRAATIDLLNAKLAKHYKTCAK